MIKKIFILFFCISISFSCKKTGIKGIPISIYITNADYSKSVYVTLDGSQSKVAAFPSYQDIDTVLIPKPLARGFWLGTEGNGETGIHSAVTSLSIYQYRNLISPDSLFKLIIDKSPFKEYYVSKEDIDLNFLRKDNGIDTSKLNSLITNNTLSTYFRRIK